jgi:hypothetical protein
MQSIFNVLVKQNLAMLVHQENQTFDDITSDLQLWDSFLAEATSQTWDLVRAPGVFSYPEDNDLIKDNADRCNSEY